MPASRSRSTDRPLDAQELNRALLARQLLLRRSPLRAERAIEHLVGLQAQSPNAPYVGLWSRLERFSTDDLSRLLRDRRVVRLALMRSTLHLVTARDALGIRPLVQPAIRRGLDGAFGRKLAGLDLGRVAALGRTWVEEDPLTLAALGARLAARWAGRDAQAMGNVVRAIVPLVQVPPRGVWGEGGIARHTSIESWLGASLDTDAPIDTLVVRYLAAFGPATILDAQKWSGLTRLATVFDRLRPRLRVFRDPRGVELFDRPRGPRPGVSTPAPPRFLPEFDNVLIAYVEPTRVVDPADHDAVFPRLGPIGATFLVDGMVRGTWRVERSRKAATLVAVPFRRLSRADTASVTAEGERLLAFAAAEADTRRVRLERR